MEGSDDDESAGIPSLIHILPLKLHHDDQISGQLEEYLAKQRGDAVSSSMQRWRMWRNLRFYKSLIGFHEGDLDLSGRHRERYTTLKTAWDEYLRDFQDLCQTVTATSGDVDHGFGLIIRTVDYTFADEGLWEQFQKKWHINPFFGTSVFRWTDAVLDVMRQYPEPKFQKLCLYHLPVELIQQIYEFAATEDAKALSSTSRYMRSLVLPRIFGRRTIRLDPGLTWLRAFSNAKTRVEDVQSLLKAATESRGRYIETSEFIFSRPDLVKSLTSLSLLNLWNLDEQFEGTTAQGLTLTDLDENFFVPVEWQNHRLLQITVNLTELRMLGFSIGADFVRITTQLPSLTKLFINRCSLTGEAQALAIGAHSPKYERVLDLSILFRSRMQEEDETDLWHLVPLCPNVQLFTACALGVGFGFVLPLEELWDRLSPFKVAEKIAFLGLAAWEVHTLGNWITRTAGSGAHPIRMTHFKLLSEGSFGEMGMSSLAGGLSHVQDLQVCVFGGIHHDAATTRLIDLISHFIPNILGLTINIASMRQHQQCRVWPSPMWAYGSHFSSFPRLLYFGWDNYFDDEITPAQMLFIEEGYPSGDGAWTLLKQVDDDAYLYDFERTGAVFFAYCPSLRFVGLDQGHITMLACAIERGESGVKVERHEIGSPILLQESEKWNTHFSRGW